MDKKLYFSKIEYREKFIYSDYFRSVLLLNIPERELSYQEYFMKRKMPAVEGTKTDLLFEDDEYTYDYGVPAKKIRNYKTNFETILIEDEPFDIKVGFSYGIKLTVEKMKETLPYCEVNEFEKFRGKKMSMNDRGFIGYRDEIQLFFRAVTDSGIPLLELPMNYYYDEEHIWPSEKLYRYLVKTFFAGKKKLIRHRPYY